MLISLLLSNPIVFVILAGLLVFSVTVHEFAHAWVADKLGDPTPRYQGRVTLDPRAHLDPIGTLAILFIGFGWGKAVVFDPYNLKNPTADIAKIALAGPAINILVAIVCAVLLKIIALPPTGVILSTAIYLNVMLSIFNLIPVYPLDGSKILPTLLPKTTALEYDRFMRQYGTWILLFLILPIGGSSAVSKLISPIIDLVVKMLV